MAAGLHSCEQLQSTEFKVHILLTNEDKRPLARIGIMSYLQMHHVDVAEKRQTVHVGAFCGVRDDSRQPMLATEAPFEGNGLRVQPHRE